MLHWACMFTPREILGPDGRIAKRLRDYEHRPQQLEMADAVAHAIRQHRHLIVEAGTGVGKSFGYLVPAILAACQEDESTKPAKPIVISTHTISLQEQLLNKDLPLLRSVIPYEFTSLLVKGRGNYVSLRRLQNALARSRSLFREAEEFDQLHQIRNWSVDSRDGSLSDLPFRPRSDVWDEVASDSSNCMGRQCPLYNKCYYYRARRYVQSAQVLVVNHALFFSDLALRRAGISILPDYQVAILDEAHTLESVAGQHMGWTVSSGSIEFQLNKLYAPHSNKGLLVHYHLDRAQQMVLRCRHLVDELVEELFAWHERTRNTRVRTPDVVESTLPEALRELACQVEQDGQRIDDPATRQDFMAAQLKLIALAQEIDGWLKQVNPDYVYWIETGWTRHQIPKLKMSAAPIDVAPSLRATLFDGKPTVILTSATLSVGRNPSFDFFQQRVGLTQCDKLRLGSPFNYRDQAKIIVVRGMPDPNDQKEDYERLCTAMIQRYAERTDGHAFVLFTSYDMIRRVSQRITHWLVSQNLALYSQADGVPRERLLAQFKKNPRGVLFGTDSFWQGVDVPGDALQNVIIPKLPFSVPDHPLLEARLDAIRTARGNPFRDYQLPEAIIKLRQGFGRLIRTASDRGIVVLLDPRLRTKPYGQLFLDSLPDCEVVEEPV
ncbi:MAG: ATP-dependent DNA helicase [Pirellulaceae bacterium]